MTPKEVNQLLALGKKYNVLVLKMGELEVHFSPPSPHIEAVDISALTNPLSGPAEEEVAKFFSAGGEAPVRSSNGEDYIGSLFGDRDNG